MAPVLTPYANDRYVFLVYIEREIVTSFLFFSHGSGLVGTV